MTAYILRTLVLFLAGATLAASFAQAQQAAQGSVATAQGATATSSTSATSPSAGKTSAPSDGARAQAPKPAATARKPVDSNAQLIIDARNAGFRPEKIRGAQMFCRTAIELGSNFPVRTCYDADQVKIKIQEYQAQRSQLEQMHSTGLMTH
jgi:hypothetical protein